MRRRSEVTVIVPLAALASFTVAAAMVSVRGEVHAEVTVLLLAATVAAGARFGGRRAGVAAALMAAASFDFFHTQPYLSLAIKDGDDILTTILLLTVGLVVGGLSTKASEERREARTIGEDGAAVRRVLSVAVEGEPADVELAVRAEIVDLLRLQRCDFTIGPVELPLLGRAGELPTHQLTYHDEGFELPVPAFAVPVDGAGHRLGYLVCEPIAGIGVHGTNRRTAVALAEVLGLVLRANSAGAGR